HGRPGPDRAIDSAAVGADLVGPGAGRLRSPAVALLRSEALRRGYAGGHRPVGAVRAPPPGRRRMATAGGPGAGQSPVVVPLVPRLFSVGRRGAGTLAGRMAVAARGTALALCSVLRSLMWLIHGAVL